ncbi:hypothetical protein ANCCAN_23284 [Ancylostoma caninum]|uniref:Uncharacterized protein n=1 Tax=Ancylostoma caninum TaxID=29170 RepID=A0A368FFW2_ANCCA|nr:hypothetical protein ANCCAN_23284 [Ancylostoma caninum]
MIKRLESDSTLSLAQMWARLDLNISRMTMWRSVIFSVENEFNLDDLDRYRHYWRDLRKEPLMSSRHTSGGGEWTPPNIKKCWERICSLFERNLFIIMLVACGLLSIMGFLSGNRHVEGCRENAGNLLTSFEEVTTSQVERAVSRVWIYLLRSPVGKTINNLERAISVSAAP